MNIHQLLNLDTSADRVELRRAYRQALKDHHPDVSATSADTEFVDLLVRAWREFCAVQLSAAANRPAESFASVVRPAVGSAGTVWLDIEGDVNEVADSVYVVASWLGDPYQVDLPDAFDMILQDPSDAFCFVSFAQEESIVRVSLTVRPRLGNLVVDESTVAQRFAEELQRLWASEL